MLGRLKPGVPVGLDEFLLVHPEKRAAGNVQGFIQTLKMMAGGKPKSAPTKRPPSGKAKYSQAPKAKPRKRR